MLTQKRIKNAARDDRLKWRGIGAMLHDRPNHPGLAYMVRMPSRISSPILFLNVWIWFIVAGNRLSNYSLLSYQFYQRQCTHTMITSECVLYSEPCTHRNRFGVAAFRKHKCSKHTANTAAIISWILCLSRRCFVDKSKRRSENSVCDRNYFHTHKVQIGWIRCGACCARKKKFLLLLQTGQVSVEFRVACDRRLLFPRKKKKWHGSAEVAK